MHDFKSERSYALFYILLHKFTPRLIQFNILTTDRISLLALGGTCFDPHAY